MSELNTYVIQVASPQGLLLKEIDADGFNVLPSGHLLFLVKKSVSTFLAGPIPAGRPPETEAICCFGPNRWLDVFKKGEVRSFNSKENAQSTEKAKVELSIHH